jgi:hypothetical protein
MHLCWNQIQWRLPKLTPFWDWIVLPVIDRYSALTGEVYNNFKYCDYSLHWDCTLVYTRARCRQVSLYCTRLTSSQAWGTLTVYTRARCRQVSLYCTRLTSSQAWGTLIVYTRARCRQVSLYYTRLTSSQAWGTLTVYTRARCRQVSLYCTRLTSSQAWGTLTRVLKYNLTFLVCGYAVFAVPTRCVMVIGDVFRDHPMATI